MRVDTADARADKPRKGESPYQRAARREARKRSFGQRLANFVSDIQTGLIVALFLFAAGLGGLVGLRMMGYENEIVALKHLVSGTDCAVAGWLGMAPAGLEEPGYWMHLDLDKDGTTCEEPR